jgi:carbonic anhydrase
MIAELLDRNVAWSLERTRRDPDYFRRLAAQQSPKYLWIGCSDSRVPANEIVGLDPGELFVHRNVANVVHTNDLNLLSVLEFAVEILRVEHIIVCGHYGCGGVRRALAPGHPVALIDHWLAPIVDLQQRRRDVLGPIADETTRVNTLCELNVEMQVGRVAATPILKAAWKSGQALTVHGWIYGLSDGLIRDLGVSVGTGAEARPGAAGELQEIDEAHSPDERVERAWIRAVRLLSQQRLTPPR